MQPNSGWFSLEAAAAYLNMGKTALYTLAREGRIPAQKVGKKWVFEKTSVDTWVRASSLDSFFLAFPENSWVKSGN